NMAGLDNATPSDDGYEDFTDNGKNATVKPGNSYTLKTTVYYDPTMLDFFSGKVDYRLWIDWNQDFDFEDEGEMVVSKLVDCASVTSSDRTVQAEFTVEVPATAKLGTTRMRFYEDMLVSDGHQEPTPCGYAGSLGQHGECEDYALEVSNTASITKPEARLVSVYPNPTSGTLFFSEQVETITVYDLQGMQVASYSNTSTIDLGELTKGMYIVHFTTVGGELVSTRITHM
ncbi:MAG: T9SS type A sorting domain-containing protein, partial [Bacteroidia bacterium]|nr:T9SS type A sorting domain-containing protein [Bacteroidia bacterium]